MNLILYKNVFGAVLSATGKTSIAKKAGAKAQAALKGPIGAIQDILPCITSKIISGIGNQIKSLLQGIADNVSNFVSCIADQFIGGLMNTIIGGITGFLGPLLGPVSGILDFVGGFDIGGFLRSKAEGLNALLNILTCDTSEPTFNKKTGEWTIGKGAKNALGVSVDAILAVANAADGLVDAVVDGLQEISVASGSLGVWDFMNPSVSNPGFKSPLGECYAGPPLDCAGIKINIFGSNGVGGAAKAIIGNVVGEYAEATGSLIGIDLTNGGSGYNTPPFVEIVDKCNKGYGAVARAVVDYDEDSPTYQQITDIYIVSEGENYPVVEDNLEGDTPYIVDHVVVVDPGFNYDSDDTVIDNEGNEYTIYVDTENNGKIVNVLPRDSAKVKVKEVKDLPELIIETKTGYGAILKPQIKPRPDYQGEVEQVIDCVS